MRIVSLDPRTDPRWAALVAAARSGSVFGHPAWLELVSRRYRYGMSALCVQDGGELVLGLPVARVESPLTGRRLVAVPFSDVCPPVRTDAAGPDADAALASAVVALRQETGLDVEIRAPLPVPGAHVVPRFLVHRLVLDADADAVLARSSKSQIRRGIRKAVREGATTQVGTGRAALEAFYALHLRTRRRQGVPIQPKSFILAFEALFTQGLGHVMTVHHEGAVISAAVFLTHGPSLVYKYGASDERALHLRPNNLLFADAIRRGCDEGRTELDFGRTDTDNQGLAAFKRAWGASEEPLSYTYVGERLPRQGDGLLHKAIAEAVRRGPPATGRLIGTALYRHVG